MYILGMKMRIHIERSPETGHLFAKSDDLQGFHAHGPSLESLLNNIAGVIAFIHQYRGEDIGKVSVSMDPTQMDWDVNPVVQIEAQYEVKATQAA